MKTKILDPKKIEVKWHIIDAKDQVLGRLASRIAKILIGKNKAEFTPNHSIADKIVVINSSQIRVTGNKATAKIYYRHSNYPGGLKSESFEKRIVRRPNKTTKGITIVKC
jgi:large subunit ribosomal protein L13